MVKTNDPKRNREAVQGPDPFPVKDDGRNALEARLTVYVKADEDATPLPPGVDAQTHDEGHSLPPVAEFQTPGEYITGTLIKIQENVGPNNSRLYYFARTPDEAAYSIWGSTILDGKMDALRAAPGDVITVQYLGDVETQRAQNPAKNFRVFRRKLS